MYYVIYINELDIAFKEDIPADFFALEPEIVADDCIFKVKIRTGNTYKYIPLQSDSFDKAGVLSGLSVSYVPSFENPELEVYIREFVEWVNDWLKHREIAER
jgi:hypothetical protein